MTGGIQAVRTHLRIVLPGGNGQVGNILARHFHAQGHDVVVQPISAAAKLPKHRTREASAAPAASFKSASGKWDKPIDEQSVALIGLADVAPCSFVRKSVADHMNRVDMVCKKPTNEP
jgi:hypothetical protein